MKRVVRKSRSIPSGVKQISKQSIRKTIVHLKHLLNAHPGLKSRLLLFIEPFPGLKAKLKSVSPIYTNVYLTVNRIDGPDKLPAHARKIYDKLKTSIEKQERGV